MFRYNPGFDLIRQAVREGGLGERNVTGHFEFEEKMVFPPILLGHATPETIKLILELQREHGSILKELEAFQKIISEKVFPLDAETYERLNIMGRRIIDSLLRHASKEDDKLLPILRENSRIFDRQEGIAIGELLLSARRFGVSQAHKPEFGLKSRSANFS